MKEKYSRGKDAGKDRDRKILNENIMNHKI